MVFSYPTEELFPIVCKLSEQLTGNDSTSITFDTAEVLLGAVTYCIDYLKNDLKPVPNGISAEQAYHLGYELIIRRTKELMDMYNKLSECFEDYGVECLRTAYQVQIPNFFLKYDPKFNPQDILLFDYPILADISQLRGIEAFEKYFKCICFEQSKLAEFEVETVKSRLYAYHKDYRNLYENIYWIMFKRDYPFE